MARERKPHTYDPNHSTSTALVEVRTVLSRCRTALEVLDGNGEFTTLDAVWWGGQHEPAETIPHPDIEEMKAVLRTTVAGLAKWERRGSRRGA